MDDFYLICEDKAALQEAWRKIAELLALRGLELNGKTNIFPLRNGLDFLGFHSYLTDSGKVIRKVRRSSKSRMARKEIEDSYRSWRAHASHGNCRNLVLEFDQRVQKIFSEGRSETRGTKN